MTKNPLTFKHIQDGEPLPNTALVSPNGLNNSEIHNTGEVYQKYYNEAFVVMQYFGYLRRDPDISYLQWIQTMNQNGRDYRVMINGFLNSQEFPQRFGR